MKSNGHIEDDIHALSVELFGDNSNGKRNGFEKRLLNIYTRTEGKQFLLVHNPGGWGSTPVDNLLQWERSIIIGVEKTVTDMGYSGELVQYFRSKTGVKAVINDIREQLKFFAFKSKVMAEELKFIARYRKDMKIVLIGVSQGAAFSNAVLQQMNGQRRIFSIEIGTPFFYKNKRVVSEQTLSLDNNGLMPDSLMEWNVPVILKTYFTAPIRWVKYRLQGKKVKFTYCINVPGHDYNWDYPEVQGQIERFLKMKFDQKSDEEAAVK